MVLQLVNLALKCVVLVCECCVLVVEFCVLGFKVIRLVVGVPEEAGEDGCDDEDSCDRCCKEFSFVNCEFAHFGQLIVL